MLYKFSEENTYIIYIHIINENKKIEVKTAQR